MTFNAGSGGAWGRRGADDRLERHGVVHDRRRRLRPDVRSTALRQQRGRRAHGRRRAEVEETTSRQRTGNGCANAISIRTTRRPSFTYKGRELIAASGKECRDVPARSASRPAAPTTRRRSTRATLFCNEEVDFQDAGSWGALSTWEDPVGNALDPRRRSGARALEVQVRGHARSRRWRAASAASRLRDANGKLRSGAGLGVRAT